MFFFFGDLRVLARTLASPFSNPTQTCGYLQLLGSLWQEHCIVVRSLLPSILTSYQNSNRLSSKPNFKLVVHHKIQLKWNTITNLFPLLTLSPLTKIGIINTQLLMVPDQRDRRNGAWTMHENAQKLEWKTHSKISCHHTWLLHGKNCPFRKFLNGKRDQ